VINAERSSGEALRLPVKNEFAAQRAEEPQPARQGEPCHLVALALPRA